MAAKKIKMEKWLLKITFTASEGNPEKPFKMYAYRNRVIEIDCPENGMSLDTIHANLLKRMGKVLDEPKINNNINVGWMQRVAVFTA